ncbi:ParB/Srx family N-terminal domain-containing protein [Yinghuangia soli]|uniref:ParB/Srx family N-terminal domain-containing protein n=1 Tax=Yinghuangia soli TaxID=2908204 RepID=A0AA41PZP5_9ACTN|nr:ParB/Srx family N-terminal domain-containing protein [Yinghuangia soli]MCF2528889.1 ParB/Srx family N-terminal domain-containing protein [Yinghuangia soli]
MGSGGRAVAGRTAASALAGVLAVAGAVAGTSEAQAAPAGAQDAAAAASAQPGTLLDVTLDALHPTQPVVGYDEVYYKLGRYRSGKDAANGDANKRFDDWCEASGQGEAASAQPDARLDDASTFTCDLPRGQETAASVAAMKTAVVGPGGKLYLTDGHHTFTSFLETADGGADTRVRVRITDNFSHLSKAEFWARMQAEGKVWLRDENDQPITADQLPARLGLANFHDDPYRSLVYFTRDIGYATPDDAAEFLEFSWGSWLRGRVDVNEHDLNDPAAYLALVEQASRAMVALDPNSPVAYGRTAAELGKLDQWNAGKKPTGGEFAKLSKPIAEAKPGKLAYALDFKAAVGTPPVCTNTVTGTHNGPLIAASGTTCIDRAQVRGPIVVRPGAGLVVKGSTVNGPISAAMATTVQVCGTDVRGPVAVTATSGLVRIGGTGCTADAISGPVSLTANRGGVEVSGNTIGGPLACVANEPAPTNASKPNTVRGPRAGQCAGL